MLHKRTFGIQPYVTLILIIWFNWGRGNKSPSLPLFGYMPAIPHGFIGTDCMMLARSTKSTKTGVIKR